MLTATVTERASGKSIAKEIASATEQGECNADCEGNCGDD